MLWGAAYGIVVGSTRKPRTMYGLLFGPLVWSTAYVALPPTGIYKPMREYDAKTLWKDASAHLTFGLGTSVAYRIMAGRG